MKTEHHIFNHQIPEFHCPFCSARTMYFYSNEIIDDRLEIEECEHLILISNDNSGIDLDPFRYGEKLGNTTSIEHYSRYFSDDFTCCVLNLYDKEDDFRYNIYLIYKRD